MKIILSREEIICAIMESLCNKGFAPIQSECILSSTKGPGGITATISIDEPVSAFEVEVVDEEEEPAVAEVPKPKKEKIVKAVPDVPTEADKPEVVEETPPSTKGKKSLFNN